jgi:hypothetical protein
MTNELTRVLDAIKKDPHGEVARQASHWLAVNVMGWESRLPFSLNTFGTYLTGEPYGIVAWTEWQPFTDANHTRMLVIKVGVRLYDDGLFLAGYPAIHRLDPYSDDPTHDACQVLRKCHAESTLTDEILKGFLG